MKIPVSLRLLSLACALAPFGHAAPQLKSVDVTIVTALSADDALGGTLTVSIDDIGNDSLSKRIAQKVQTAAAKAGYARVCIVRVDRDGVATPSGDGETRLSGVVTMPDGSSFSAPSAGPGFMLHRVFGELVIREVTKKTSGS